MSDSNSDSEKEIIADNNSDLEIYLQNKNYKLKTSKIFKQKVENLLMNLNRCLSSDLVYVIIIIIGEARNFIAYQNVNNWLTIKPALLQKYGDHRNEDVLASDLRRLTHSRNELYLDFYNKILKALNDLMQCVRLYVNDPNLRTYKKIEYEKLELKTFQLGILEPYRGFLIHFDLKNLEECFNKCQFFDNRKQEEQYYDYMREPIKRHQIKNNQFSRFSKPSTHYQKPISYTPRFELTSPTQPRPFQSSINKLLNQ
ncbi:hypothetical protein FQA39_LY13291 [Lamprigera yunnana]|nr:hypothetical protein FQA39_LY13291 [Lamprigera yunnana]